MVFRESFSSLFVAFGFVRTSTIKLLMGMGRLDGCANESGQLGKIVRSMYSVDRFAAGVLLGAVAGWLASVGVDHWELFSAGEHRFGLRLMIEAAAAACLVLPRPLLLKTVFRSRRSVFMRDADVDAMLRARALGIASGLWVGATINSMFF